MGTQLGLVTFAPGTEDKHAPALAVLSANSKTSGFRGKRRFPQKANSKLQPKRLQHSELCVCDRDLSEAVRRKRTLHGPSPRADVRGPATGEVEALPDQ